MQSVATTIVPHRWFGTAAMVMLSKLRRFKVRDAGGETARLADVAVSLVDCDYPPVTHLIFRQKHPRAEMCLPWEAVTAFDSATQVVNVTDLASAKSARTELEGEVLLGRDVLDALVIDLEDGRATRANDLWIEEKEGTLILKAADASAKAVARRLSGGRFCPVDESKFHDWKYIEFLRGDPGAAGRGASYHMRIKHLPPGEIARLCDPLPYLHVAELIVLLPDDIAADVMEFMAPERQLQVFEELDQDQATRILALMAPDVSADLVGHLLPEAARSFLNRLPRKQALRVIDLLRYPEDTVGGMMNNDIASVAAHLTIKEARQVLHEELREPNFINFIYVVASGEEQRLCGVMAMRKFFISEDDQKIEDVMNRYVITLRPYATARAAAFKVLTSGLAALPVVAHDGRLLGAVTIDDAIEVVSPGLSGEPTLRVFS